MKTIYILQWDGTCKYFGSVNSLIKELKSFGSESFNALTIDGINQEFALDAKLLRDLIDIFKANNMNTRLTIKRDFCGMPLLYVFFIYKEIMEE